MVSPSEHDDGPDGEPEAPRSTPPPVSARAPEVLGSVSAVGRVAWLAIGLALGSGLTWLLTARPWVRNGDGGANAGASSAPYEGLPFADNAGVCQEYVALGGVRVPHAEARALAARLGPALPPSLRADNVRVVRAFAAGESWTVAVDAQPGAGDMEGARRVSNELNATAAVTALPLRFEPVFYSTRRLYESAHVLCLPRDTVNAGAGH